MLTMRPRPSLLRTSRVSDDPKPLEDYDDWRDLPEAQAVHAALEALATRCAESPQLLNEYSIVCVTMPLDDPECHTKYHTFHSSVMPHTSQGLLTRGLQWLRNDMFSRGGEE